MRILASHNVPENIESIRIYDYCNGLFDQLPSRKGVKKAIEKGQIRLNGEPTKTGHWLKGGEHIELLDLERTPPKTYQLALEVIFEDEHLAVILKPAGLLTSGNSFKTVTNALQHNLEQSNELDRLDWPLPAHRLDKATSGILVVAKTKKARMSLGQQFEDGVISKTYHAVILGIIKGKGSINEPIDGKEAITEFESLKTVNSLRSGNLTLVKLIPRTGRTHQLRIHLSQQGNAILGDPIYSPPELFLKHKGLFLCATAISFMHPIKREPIDMQIPIPQKFTKRMDSEEKRWVKQNLT